MRRRRVIDDDDYEKVSPPNTDRSPILFETKFKPLKSGIEKKMALFKVRDGDKDVDLRAIVKTFQEGVPVYEIVYDFPSRFPQHQPPVSPAALDAVIKKLDDFSTPEAASRQEVTCRREIEWNYINTLLNHDGNIVFYIVDMKVAASSAQKSGVRAVAVASMSSRETVFVDLVCVKASKNEVQKRKYRMASGAALMAILEEYAVHILAASEITLVPIPSALLYYGQFGFEYKDSCAPGTVPVPIPEFLQRRQKHRKFTSARSKEVLHQFERDLAVIGGRMTKCLRADERSESESSLGLKVKPTSSPPIIFSRLAALKRGPKTRRNVLEV